MVANNELPLAAHAGGKRKTPRQRPRVRNGTSLQRERAKKAAPRGPSEFPPQEHVSTWTAAFRPRRCAHMAPRRFHTKERARLRSGERARAQAGPCKLLRERPAGRGCARTGLDTAQPSSSQRALRSLLLARRVRPLGRPTCLALRRFSSLLSSRLSRLRAQVSVESKP